MSLRVIDSHTGGEPTRLVVSGLPEISGSVHDRLAGLRESYDWIRTSVCLEPRGSEVAVGAALFPPSSEGCLADVVFFNNTSYLGMCGHGTIGVLVSLVYAGRIGPGRYSLNTVAGPVTAEVKDASTVAFRNVPAYRMTKGATVVVGGRTYTGDVAYGGNWFFLCDDHGLEITVARIPEATALTSALMSELARQGVTGRDGAKIDHIELFGPPTPGRADSKSFVLCPGGQFDRSPCGTGTSAKLACLFEDGKLAESQVWRQESVIGSVFAGWVDVVEGRIVPSIEGQAFVMAETTVVECPDDPYRHGIVP
ncbi:MAG: proline racemase family protein [Armatimonadetes bacterium]|nr:proline racemase family protein [Armatimonadota bacterium]